MKEWFRSRNKAEPFMPPRQVYWLGGYCQGCGVPLLSDPKIEVHAEYCPIKNQTQTFRTRIETKESEPEWADVTKGST